MLKVIINDGTGEKDYTKYVVDQTISMQKSVNVPTTCTLSMSNFDNNFKVPAVHSYIRIYSTKHQRSLFTGLLTNDPTRNFLGVGRSTSCGGQVQTFQFSFTSEEYLLNIKSVPVVPAFINQPQGFIMQSLAETLCPGYFDFTYCCSGDIVPYLQYDPTQTWSQIVKTFADPSMYRYSVIDKQIHYVPQGDGHLGIEFNEDKGQGSFDPFSLTVSALTTPMVNDVTIIGEQEAGNNHEDYFIGDGFSGAFPLNYKVFGLANAETGSGIILSDSWNATSLNTQNWFADDPQNNFFYGADSSQALNILTGIPNIAGTSCIVANNALELAGGLVLQHGEFMFNDISEGVIGGIYDSSMVINGFQDISLNENAMVAGFLITPSQNVITTASGASGISIQPYVANSSVPAKAFQVLTAVNCSYILTTTITAPAASRYNQVFRTQAGIAYGGGNNSIDVLGNITWTVTQTNAFTGVQTVFTFTQSNVTLPQTALYAIIDNWRLNITCTTTALIAPIPGSLNATCEMGVGLLAPIYVSGIVQYTGGFVTPSGGNLPILPGDFGPENNFALGSSLQNQAAEVDSGQITDTLNFYSDDLPGVGVRVRFQAWESQAAIARVQDPTSIGLEAAVVGDNGIRAATVSNLNPLPRTSEDCEYACQAYITDRVGVFYQGSYNANSLLFFKQPDTDDIEFFPATGRYLYINAPRFDIVSQNFLVTAITTTVTEMVREVIQYSLTFGPDLHLPKLLAALVPQPQNNVLLPTDTVVAPTPQQLLAIGTNYLPDIQQTTISAPISGNQIRISLNDALSAGAHFEIRSSNMNFGTPTTASSVSNLVAVAATTGTVLLPRSAYDQTWFIKQVSTTSSSQVIASRRTKVLRVYYPQIPSTPMFISADSSTLDVDFSGDTRNVEGIELRDGQTDSVIYYQAIVGSEFDMDLNLGTLRGQLQPGQAGTGPIGQFQYNLVPATQRNFNVHFFNLMWEYSPALSIYIPPPDPPVLSEGYYFSGSLQLIMTQTDPITRQDINYTTLEIANDPSFDTNSILINLQTVGAPGWLTVNVPVTGALYARASLTDQISSGGWSPVLNIPQENLINSTYLSAQGSIPPAVTNSFTASGGIFSYLGYYNAITMASEGFAVQYPNGSLVNVAPFTQTFFTSLDEGALAPDTMYGFFPAIQNPLSPNPALVFHGPFANYLGSAVNYALTGQFADGSTPLTNGAFVAQTNDYVSGNTGSTVGGGGGGTYGGGNCGEINRWLLCSDGTRRKLKDVTVGQRVINRAGRVSKIRTKVMLLEDTVWYKTKSGLETETAYGHVLFSEDEWQTLEGLLEQNKIYVETDRDKLDEILEVDLVVEKKYICKLELEPCDLENATDEDHTYNLDGFWAHNLIYKSE